MKKIILSLLTMGVAGLLATAVAQDMPGDGAPPPEMGGGPGGDNGPGGPDAGGAPVPLPEDAAATNATAANGQNGPGANAVVAPQEILPGQSKTTEADNIPSDFVPPAQASGTNNPDELRLNFRNAPLELVLNYLSDAAGFIIVLDTRVNGNVSVISSRPMTRDEAVDLLNSVLNKNGYAAIRNGRTLTIVDKNDAKTRDIPVKTGNNPDLIPKNAEIVTQIIPIRFVEARQLVSDLTSFVSPQATVVANEAGNSIVITDTQSNIRHLAEIIKAIDDSAEASTEIRVFQLKYASPTDVATELGNVFPSSSGSGTQSPISFGGRGNRGGMGGGPGAMFAAMMSGGNSASGSADRIKKATQVTAVADARIQAVIVTAPKDLMEQIGEMIKELDVASDRDQDVYVVQLKNADPQQALQVLQNLFPTSSSSRNNSSSSQNSPLQTRVQNAATTMGTTTTTSGIGGSGTSGGGGGRTGGF
jgi:type II secretory pathway component GspD/PulD (secretin)